MPKIMSLQSQYFRQLIMFIIFPIVTHPDRFLKNSSISFHVYVNELIRLIKAMPQILNYSWCWIKFFITYLLWAIPLFSNFIETITSSAVTLLAFICMTFKKKIYALLWRRVVSKTSINDQKINILGLSTYCFLYLSSFLSLSLSPQISCSFSHSFLSVLKMLPI